MRQRIMYVMNVDWDWAKQRPHFLAQHLSRLHDVVIFYPYSLKRSHLAKNSRDGLRLYPFIRLPFGGKFAFIRKVNKYIIRPMARIFIKLFRPDIVWVSSPELFEYLPKHLSEKLIYDCMDDVLAFPRNAPHLNSLMASENELISSSLHVLCSSANLRKKLISRAGYYEKFTVVYNAFEPSAFSSNPADLPERKVGVVTEREGGRFVLGYVGTISSWMDFKAIDIIVNEYPMIEIHLIGPGENLGAVSIKHERIKYLGAVSHGEIQSYVKGFDALLMPFRVTELIHSVDPVKLYEYIYFNKPIVSVNYPEIKRFEQFVYFYSSHDELLNIIGDLLAADFPVKFSVDQRMSFIAENTWENRALQIQKILK